MSSGAFSRTKYEDDNEVVHPILVQPETLQLSINSVANSAPTAGIQPGVASAQVSKGRRSIGYNTRLVSIKFSGTPPTGYKSDQVIRLPWLRKASFGPITVGATGEYLGAACTVVGKSPERIR